MTRRQLTCVLAANALTKPVNVLAPVAVLIAGVLLGVPWLLPVAVVSWLALLAVTFFDEREARVAGERARARCHSEPPSPAVLVRASGFAPEIAARVRAAGAARAAIRLVAAEDVTREVDALVVALQAHAERAQRIRDFLRGEPVDELAPRIAAEPSPSVRAALEAKHSALERLQRRLTNLLDEMDNVVTTLQTVHAEILVTDGLEQTELAGQVSELRDKVQVVSAGLEDAFTRARP